MPRLSEIMAQLRERLASSLAAGEPRSLIRALINSQCGIPYPELSPDLVLEEKQATDLLGKADLLALGHPLQYVVGRVPFHGLDLFTDPRALIPRPETEEMVELIIRTLPHSPDCIVDVGTGSGCIALALKQAFPQAQVTGLDISADALELAAHNAGTNGMDVQWRLVDALGPGLLEALRTSCSGPRNLVVSNPPYVPRSDSASMEPHVLDHEPHLALFVDDGDPHRFFRAIATAAAHVLQPGDALWFEGHYLHTPRSMHVVKKAGMAHAEVIADLCGNPRFIHAWM